MLRFAYLHIKQKCILSFALFLMCYASAAQKTYAKGEDTIPVWAESYAQVGQPLAKVFTAKQHGGHNQNWTSMQSKDGLIYIGHTLGISQWDGENWQNFPTPHLTPVRSITEWQNQLYIGTVNDLAKLPVNDSGELEYQSLLAQTSLTSDFGDTWSTAANASGVVFVTSKHIFFFDGNKLQTINEAISSSHFIFSLRDKFYYKPRHLANIYELSITNQAGDWQFNNKALDFELPKNARVMEILPLGEDDFTIVTEQDGVFQTHKQSLHRVIAPEMLGARVQLYDAIHTSDGLYYISSTYHGLFIFDDQFNLLRRYTGTDGISMDTVFSVNEDLQGNIWLTGIPNVVKMRPPHIISQFKAGNTSTEILSLINTPMGIFASGNGVFKLTSSPEYWQTPSFKLLHDNINSSVDLLEHEGKLIKTGFDGTFELNLNENASAIVSENHLIQSGLARTIVRDEASQQLFISSIGALFSLGKTSHDWTVERFPALSAQFTSMSLDEQGTLWVGSATSQLFKLDNVVTLGTAAPVTIFSESAGLGKGPVDVFTIDGQAIFSSAGRLLRYKNGQLEAANLAMLPKDWLRDSVIIDQFLQIPAKDNQPERIWYRKNGKSGYIEKNTQGKWDEHKHIFDSVESGGFNSIFMGDGNTVWFVRDKAEIYRVDMSLSQVLPAVAPLNIRSVVATNQAMAFRNLPMVSLLPQQTNIRINYASTDNSSPFPVKYRTRLVSDHDSPWSTWSEETYRDFTQLRPADYRFEVQAKDAWGRLSSSHLNINLIAPWYLSHLAFAVYALMSLLSILIFTWFVQRWRTYALEEKNRALERKVEERTKEVEEKIDELKQQQLLKDRFFSNVSHEFRTPLTLTIGPLETVLSEHKSSIEKPVSSLISTALSNANKMLALIGEVLDLNRLELGKLPLRVSQYDIALLLRNLQQRFSAWALQEGQTISCINCEEPLLLYYDQDQIEKCVANLLSNAIKYSGKNTQISIKLISEAEFVTVQVIDNGKGVSEAAKGKVFERFYQDKNSEQSTVPGTGIGLALVKELIELHAGEVALDTQIGAGCCFSLRLKKGKQHFTKEQLIEPIALSTKEQAPLEELLPLEQDRQLDKATLLVVDDNAELRHFISLRLSANYRIIQASDGEEGFNLACKALPDLIISDVMMPNMTGYQLAQKLKSKAATRSIPLILLTAKASKRDTVEGFTSGADDYLVKPFDTSELIMRVNALINIRKSIRETIIFEQNAVTSEDRNENSFVDSLHSIVLSHLSDPDFTVDHLASLLFMSRATLTRKCRAELNISPRVYMIQQRIQQASYLLKVGKLSISEVAYAVGFESLSYFSKSFKKQIGKTPSEY